MSEDPEIMLTTSQLGEILAWGAVGSIVGKFFSGIVADLIGGRVAIFLCVVCSGSIDNNFFATLFFILF